MSHTAFSEAVGEWYLGVYCRRCRAPVPVFHNPERRAVTGGTGKLTVCCPRCRKQGQYAADEMMSFLVYADRVLTAERAAVNDDHPIAPAPSGVPVPSSAPVPSGADDEPILELGPELAVEDDEEDVEPEATAEGERDNEPVTDEAGSDGDRSAEVSGAVLELGPELILEDDDDGADDDSHREDGGEDAAVELAPEPALELDQVLDDDTAKVADAAASDAAASEDAEPVLELVPATIVEDTPPEDATVDSEPEPIAAATREPEPVADAAPLLELLPTPAEQIAAPEIAAAIAEAPADMVLAEVAARDHADHEAAELEPTDDARPTDDTPIEDAPIADAPIEDVPLELGPPALEATPREPVAATEPEPVVDDLPLLEFVPDPTLDDDAEETAAASEPIVEHTTEPAFVPAPEAASLPEPEPEPEIELALTTEAAAAPETALVAEAGPVVAPASEEQLTAPETAPKVAAPPGSASLVDDIILVDWASLGGLPAREPEPTVEALSIAEAPVEEPPTEPAPSALEAARHEPAPTEIAPAELLAFEPAPVEPPPVELEPLAPEPAPEPAEAAAPAPVVAETVAPDPARPLPVTPERAAQAPVAPPPPAARPAAPKPPAPKPAPPKPIAQVYRERWDEPAKRPQVIAELRPLLRGLKARAEATDYDVLVRVADLFLDYLADVAPQRQSGVAIEQYIHAVFALSTRGRAKGTDRIGEEMAATLRALNRHAGLYIGR